jgi:hypothetical protein
MNFVVIAILIELIPSDPFWLFGGLKGLMALGNENES